MRSSQDDYQARDTDRLETLAPAATAPPADAPSSELDAGLDDANAEQLGQQPVSPGNVVEVRGDAREIPMTDLADATAGDLESPELADLNAPGEVDMEELDEDALSDTDIPRDALLDPLEE